MNKNPSINFIGIGARKSATSWLSKCLEEHPEVCIAKGKETHFFSEDDKFQQGLEYYFKNFENCNNKELIGEFSTSYLSSFKSADRIKEHFSNIKIIASLRDPVNRFKSHVKHQYFKDRIKDTKTIDQIVDRLPFLIESSLYGKYLKKYFSLFSKEQINIIFFEDVKNRPKEVVKKLYHFLEVDENFVPDIIDQKYNSSEVRSSAFYKKINKIYFFLKNSKSGKKVLNMLKKLGINSQTVQKLSYTFSRKKKIPYDFDKEKIYKKFFKEDINKLESLLSKNLNHWKYNLNN